MANEELDFSQLTEEQIAAIQELLYKHYSKQSADDNTQFVVPFIAMNDGHTPAQIKAISKGLYRDIQRNPFLRKTGVFTKDNTIEDIDITPLVYYGTLQQAKIAPTLENIDVKLYFREPKLTKVPSNTPEDGEFADTYIWREVPAGFHVFNNDTVYGYEWLVLQSNYVGTEGIYNLHMNIEDGLGVCKFAGTQAPINLAGVQYKIVITAKNLWNREFSLIDSMPLLHSLEGSSDALAPTVDAIKKYYAKAVETLKVVTKELYVNDPEDKQVLFAGPDGLIVYKNLTVGQIKNLEEYVTATRVDLDDHISEAVQGAEYDAGKKLIGPHGIVNNGFAGNIAAKTLDGLTLSNGNQAVTKDVTGKYAYIPFVENDNSIGLGTVVRYFKRGGEADPSVMFERTFEDLPKIKTLSIRDVSGQDELANVLYSLSFGSNIFNAKFYKDEDDFLVLKVSESNDQSGEVTLDIGKIVTNNIHFNGSNDDLNKDWVAYVSGASSIAYKTPISELINIRLKDSLGPNLEPNTKLDADGNPVSTLNTEALEAIDLKVAAKQFTEDGFNTIESNEALDKLGSALQALHELPLSTYTYKRGQTMYKEQIGIFVERVNQFRDELALLRGSGEDRNGVPTKDNYLVHKRVKAIQSDNAKVIDFDQGLATSDDIKDQGTNFAERVKNNAYTYTEEEIKSIAHYLDLMTSKKELAQEIRNTVGILLKAAKETQERLLDIETNIYGFDAVTLPGSDKSREKFIDAHIAKDLQKILNSSPLLLGLNRLMRALCLEIYNTTDLESIDAEIRSVVGDSDSLEEKITVKSRMDKIDDLVSDLTNQASALTKYYTENIFSDESKHTYTDIYNFEETKQTITDTADITEKDEVLDGLADDHTETKDVDKGRTWRNLPATEDVSEETKQKVSFAQIADSTHKHTPKQDESGIVRVPETYTYEHKDVDKNGKETVRSWKALKLEKDDETGTYWPVFKTKAVAWDSAKLERINKKLSEVTKDIYGTDDVTASLPNRTEVLRRNVTNLVDDLYPNRSFSVEKKFDVGDELSDIRLPFKRSNIQIPEKGLAVTGQTDEPKETEAHTSIIPYFDNELFNFEFTSNIFKDTNHKFTKDTFKVFKNYELLDTPVDYLNNKQIDVNLDTGLITFDTKKLVTDPDVFDPLNYGTYNQAYSRTDLLSNLIGVENCYPTDLFNSTIYDAFGIDKSNLSILDFPAKEQSTLKAKSEATAKLDAYNAQLQDLENLKTTTQTEIAKLENVEKLKSEELEGLEKDLEAAIQDLEEKVAKKQELTEELEKETAKSFIRSDLEEKIESLKDKLKEAQDYEAIQKADLDKYQSIVDDLQNSLAKYEGFETETDYRVFINDNSFDSKGFVAEPEIEGFKILSTKNLNLPEELSENHYEKLKFVIDDNKQVWAVCCNTVDEPDYGIYAIELNKDLLTLASKLHTKESTPNALWTKLDSLEAIYNSETDESLQLAVHVLANDIVDDLVFEDINYTVSGLREVLEMYKKLLKDVEKTYSTAQQEVENVTKELTNAQNDLDNLDEAKQEHEDLVAKYQGDLEKLVKEVSEALEIKNNLEENYQLLSKELQTILWQLNSLRNTLAETLTTIEFIESQIANLEKILDENSGTNFNIFPSYIEELKYLDSKKKVENKKIEKENVATPLAESSNLDYVLSRKQKNLQDRITTLEAFADELTRGFNLVDNTRKLPVGEITTPNIRFESQDSLETLHALAERNSDQPSENFIFDLDLSKAFSGYDSHNKSVFEIVRNSREVKKSAYTVKDTEGSYTITGLLALDPSYINFEENPEAFRKEFSKGAKVTIYVRYVKTAPDKTSKDYYHTIYLQKKELTSTNKLVEEFSTSEVFDVDTGWQNQSEYNIYNMVCSMFKNMLDSTSSVAKGTLRHAMFLSIYPVGCDYYTRDANFDPNTAFGGTWIKVTEKGILTVNENLKLSNSVVVTQGSLTRNQNSWGGHAHSFSGSGSGSDGDVHIGIHISGTTGSAGSNTITPNVSLGNAISKTMQDRLGTGNESSIKIHVWYRKEA